MVKQVKSHMISTEIASFLADQQSRKHSPNTITYYRQEIGLFADWFDPERRRAVEEITVLVLREYLAYLGERRSGGGVNAAYRALKTWLIWWVKEAELTGYINPIYKVTPPPRNTEPLPGVEPEVFVKLLAACDNSFLGRRNRAMMAFMYDSGIRVSELLALNIGDLDLQTGTALIRHGKGDKMRSVFIGAKTRRDVIRYLRLRDDPRPADPLFVTQTGGRFTREGIADAIVSVARAAGIEDIPSPHDFRRGFTIQSLRNKADVVSISRQLGHANISLVRRYARQTTADLRTVHDETSPVDNL